MTLIATGRPTPEMSVLEMRTHCSWITMVMVKVTHVILTTTMMGCQTRWIRVPSLSRAKIKIATDVPTR